MKTFMPFVLAFLFFNAAGQDFTPNYDESKIPEYELPALLVAKNGKKILSKEEWVDLRRGEILADFASNMYGKIPPGRINFEVKKIKEMSAFDGKARMKEVKLVFMRNNKKLSMDILMYLPISQSQVPVFLGLNFYGNQTILDDPNISLPSSWMRNNEELNITENIATEESRGARHSRWPVEKIIDRGYGLVTIYYGDIDPDKNDLSDGVHALYYKPGEHTLASDEWGSISAWAWGLSRAMDFFELEEEIDERRVALMGHSRLGKAALWAGAIDQRFAIVISNDSGCGGAALSRRQFGETVERINTAFPHWFCDNFNMYNNNEVALPVDQHMLIAMMAPRPVYVASAEDDQWADPKGEYLAAHYAGEVYKKFGKKGLKSKKQPKVNKPKMKSIGYHIRSGGHDVTDFDWEAWMDFADKHYKK